MPSLEHRLRDVLEQQRQQRGDGQQQQQQQPQLLLLPIFDVLQSVRESLSIKPNLLLQASPGAGKTTIVPLQLLLDLILAEKEEKQGNDDGSKDDTIINNNNRHHHKKQIVVVAPRRVAVRSAAQRMSSLIGEDNMVGNTVGYVMRDDVKISKKGYTRIKVVTDGVLLNMLRDDPLLENIDTVILDEFHERGVGSDTCLALLREVQQNFRSELKIVVMSATLLGKGKIEDEQEQDNKNNNKNNNNKDDDDNNSNISSTNTLSTGSKLMTNLGGNSGCGIIESEGRQYPIQIQWANQVVKMMSNGGGGGGGSAVNRIPPLTTLLRDRKLLIETISNVVDKAALKNAPSYGDILVFLPGVAECKGVVRELTSRSSVTNVADVFALYGAMSKDEQDRVLFYPEQQKQESDQRRRQRVIVSTPIAEASLTIPKVTCVVDSGLRREPRCDTDTGMPRLVSAKISQASSIQRSGRAGRVQEGSCLRLYTESDFDIEFIEQTPPEIGKCILFKFLFSTHFDYFV
jgi:ATP-dependent helicase HrpB